MKHLKKIGHQVAWTLFISILTLSCCNAVYDDLSKCQSNELVFSYLADADKEVLPKYISSIDLYIYTKDKHTLFEHHRIEGFEISNPNPSIVLSLPKGTYHAVAIANVYDKTKLTEEENSQKAKIGEPAGFEASGTHLSGNDRLYIVSKEIVSNPELNLAKDILRFSSAHVRMHFKITGAPKSLGKTNQPFLIRMSPLSPLVNMQNVVKMEDRREMDLFPESKDTDKGTIYQGEMNTLRFENKNDIHLQLLSKDASVTYIDAPLEKFLQDYDIQVSGRNEVDIYVRFYFKGITVRIAPWEAVDTTPVTE